MYLPDGDDSIWVPLQVVEWRCKGSATKDGEGNWSLDEGQDTNVSVPADTDQHPTWTHWTGILAWEPDE